VINRRQLEMIKPWSKRYIKRLRKLLTVPKHHSAYNKHSQEQGR
jgi:hypothetical protein